MPIVLHFGVFLNSVNFFGPFVREYKRGFFFGNFKDYRFRFSSFPTRGISTIFLFLLLAAVSVGLLATDVRAPRVIGVVAVNDVGTDRGKLWA